MLQQWMITVGILLAYIVAIDVLRVAPGSANSVDWRLFLGLGALPALAGLILRAEMPESPRWLLQHGRFDQARAALSSFGLEVATGELEVSARRLDEARAERRRRSGRWSIGVRRALVVICGYFVFQQITGINVPL